MITSTTTAASVALERRNSHRFHAASDVSARSAFAIVAEVGEDGPGAIRFAPSSRAREIARAGPGKVDWLDEHDVAERLRALRLDASAWRQSTDTGQFSLAGAQPKTALLFDGRKWGVPSGLTPTTHILKPGTTELDGHVENEHFCLVLARELGLPAAHSRVERFDDQIAIVVERYDRLVTPKGIIRVHQEDACQALAVHPAKKYENDGGPGVRAIVDLLRTYSRNAGEDIAVFVESLIFRDRRVPVGQACTRAPAGPGARTPVGNSSDQSRCRHHRRSPSPGRAARLIPSDSRPAQQSTRRARAAVRSWLMEFDIPG